MKNFINISEIGKYGLQLNDYQQRNLEDKRKEFTQFIPVCKIVEVLYISHYDEKYHAEDVAVLLNYKGFLLRAYKNHYTDKAYRFCLVEQYRHKHTHNYTNRNEMPNKVGKPTPAKMDIWLAYLLNEEEEKKAYAQKYIDEEEVFRAELEQLGDAVKWYNNGSQGHIRMNNLVFEFSIQPCYIGKTVKIDRNYDLGLSEFLKMADNKYKPASRR